MPRLLGNVCHQLDDRNRMRIPAKFKAGLGAEPFILPGRVGCLFVFPGEKYDEVAENLLNGNYYGNVAASDVATEILGHADSFDEDDYGRYKIANQLLVYADIKKDVVIVGKVDHLEIWPAEKWHAKHSILNPDNLAKILDNIQRFGEQ